MNEKHKRFFCTICQQTELHNLIVKTSKTIYFVDDTYKQKISKLRLILMLGGWNNISARLSRNVFCRTQKRVKLINESV